MMHADMNNIALRFQSGVVFTVINLQYYSWRWLRHLELIEVELNKGKLIFEVYKWEKEEDRLIAVVVPIKQEVEHENA